MDGGVLVNSRLQVLNFEGSLYAAGDCATMLLTNVNDAKQLHIAQVHARHVQHLRMYM